jgi:hypothetical protein
MLRFSLETDDLNLLGDAQPISDVKTMMKSYADRLKTTSALLSNEFVGVKLNGYDVSELIRTYGAKDFFAIFAVENNSETLILMGLDSAGKIIKDNQGNYVAIERWGKLGPTIDKVVADPNGELNKLFP